MCRGRSRQSSGCKIWWCAAAGIHRIVYTPIRLFRRTTLIAPVDRHPPGTVLRTPRRVRQARRGGAPSCEGAPGGGFIWPGGMQWPTFVLGQ